ncbi:MAG: ROK family protein, partial [Vampirovibrionales bacterium]
VLDPDIVVIGGGMAQFVELPKLQDFLNERIMEPMATTPIVFAQLGNDAGMIGAAAMAKNNSPALSL